MLGYKLMHIYGRMRSMYLGTEFHRYWAECGDALIHPRDQSYFENDKTKQCKEDCDFVTSDYGPWPFDGPMETAKIVVCYANPAYSAEDKKHQELISKQRTGVEPLPRPWHKFYKTRIADPLGKSVESLESQVAIFNVCPYPSISMPDRAIRFAAGLPSVWAAQKYLREVLIPNAKAGKIFLVIARKHMLWGVNDGITEGNISCVRNRFGKLDQVTVEKIHNWMTSQERCESPKPEN
jgi:hypothetical protein